MFYNPNQGDIMQDWMRPFVTLRQARSHAAALYASTGVKRAIFRVPDGTMAHQLGLRFGVCSEAERAEYERDGAKFVKES